MAPTAGIVSGKPTTDVDEANRSLPLPRNRLRGRHPRGRVLDSLPGAERSDRLRIMQVEKAS